MRTEKKKLVTDTSVRSRRLRRCDLTVARQKHHVHFVLLCAAVPQLDIFRQIHEVVDLQHHPFQMVPERILRRQNRGFGSGNYSKDYRPYLPEMKALRENETLKLQ